MPPPHKIRRERKRFLILNFLKKPDFTRLTRSLEIRREIEKTVFQQTVHCETVCLLSKLHEAKHHVNVKLDMDEMDLTAAESKVTYEEIKSYVAEHHDGMHTQKIED